MMASGDGNDIRGYDAGDEQNSAAGTSYQEVEWQKVNRRKRKRFFTGPDSLVVRASAAGSEGRGFAPWPRHTKGVKNGTGCSLADACNKRLVLGRYKNAVRYLLLVMSQ